MITKDQAIYLSENPHLHIYSDLVVYKGRHNFGKPYAFRVNGRIKLWKTRPNEFRLPLKYGFRNHYYLDHTNCHEFFTTEMDCIAARNRKVGSHI